MKASKEGLSAQNYAAEIKLLAERKAGALLAAMEMNKGGQGTGNNVLPVLEDLGVSKMQSSRWQKEATVSDEDFSAIVGKCLEDEVELTQALVLKSEGVHFPHSITQEEFDLLMNECKHKQGHAE